MSIQTPLTESQIEFMEALSCPTAMTECLIPENLDAPQTWGKNCKTIALRDYQFAMQNYSYVIAEDPNLSDVENFRWKKLAGDLYSIGSRNTGKSMWLIIDVVLSYIHGVKQGCVASFDSDHLKKVTDAIASFIESHKFCKIFNLKSSKKDTVTRQPFKVTSEQGSVIFGVNEQSDGKKPGVGYHSKHFTSRWFEEFSYSSSEGNKKAVDAESSLGHIERPSGIPDLCIGSPLGKILQNPKLKNWIWRLPQYVRSDYTERVHQEKIEEYNGESNPAFLLNVLAKTIEGAYGFFDMERLRESSIKKSGIVKFFEVNKDNFNLYESILHLDRIAGSESCWIAADLGFGSAPTEIIVLFFDGKKYKYTYNITLYRLTPEEQPKVFKHLYDKLGGAFIALDSTSDSGAMIERLYAMGIPRENLLAVKFNENIAVDFERDENNNALVDKTGSPILKMAGTEDWSFKELERLMYNKQMEIPFDAKFLNQFTNVIATNNRGKVMYGSKGENHLVQSFQCFSICRFFNEFKNLKNEIRTKRGWGSFNVRKK